MRFWGCWWSSWTPNDPGGGEACTFSQTTECTLHHFIGGRSWACKKFCKSSLGFLHSCSTMSFPSHMSGGPLREPTWVGSGQSLGKSMCLSRDLSPGAGTFPYWPWGLSQVPEPPELQFHFSQCGCEQNLSQVPYRKMFSKCSRWKKRKLSIATRSKYSLQAKAFIKMLSNECKRRRFVRFYVSYKL